MTRKPAYRLIVSLLALSPLAAAGQGPMSSDAAELGVVHWHLPDAAVQAASADTPSGYHEAIEAITSGQYQAAYWQLKPLAEAGYAQAQVALAELFRNGQGVQVSIPTAIRYYRDAARRGSAEAAYRLAAVYASDEGGVARPEKAERWLARAAELGHAEATRRLATLAPRLARSQRPYADPAEG